MKATRSAHVARCGVAAVCLSLMACGTQRSYDPGDGHIQPGTEAAAAEGRQAPTSADIPDPVTTAPMPPAPSSARDAERYTVVVNEVPVKELLFALARDADIEIDIIGDITGTVTLNAIDATLPRLLERISLQAPIRYRLDDDYLKIAADAPYLESYPVPYVNIDRDSSSSVETSTQIASTGGAAGEGQSSGGAGSNNSSTTISSESEQRLWQTLRGNLAGILNVEVSEGDAPDSDRYIMINREAGYITVRATQRQHVEVQRYLDQVMASVRRQVLIEATVVEVTLSDRYQAGVDWALLANEADGFDFVQSLTGSALGGAFNVPDPPATGSSQVTIGYSDPDTSDGSLSSTIKMLETFGDVQVMSSPKIIALNNQLAMLKVVDNRVYFTVEVETDTTESGTVTRTFETEVNTVPVGLVMTVTPHIDSSEEVLLNVRPTVSRILGFVNDPNPDLANAGVENAIPEIQVREMESLLRVHSGQTAVIGGLMQDSLDETSRGVPGLSRLPLLGRLFQYRDDTVEKTELIIFLRPRVINRASLDGDFQDYRRYLSPRSTRDAGAVDEGGAQQP
ncbi:MAG: pilus (MSHA type) biogenesis protein MshL [Halofilum sp. (in: g-proteobacteria)]|nr:pilus (MSHA type) biogenesis protein MshL [Halofilum sp. (in: g-proteobacteria)]